MVRHLVVVVVVEEEEEFRLEVVAARTEDGMGVEEERREVTSERRSRSEEGIRSSRDLDSSRRHPLEQGSDESILDPCHDSSPREASKVERSGSVGVAELDGREILIEIANGDDPTTFERILDFGPAMEREIEFVVVVVSCRLDGCGWNDPSSSKNGDGDSSTRSSCASSWARPPLHFRRVLFSSSSLDENWNPRRRPDVTSTTSVSARTEALGSRLPSLRPLPSSRLTRLHLVLHDRRGSSLS